MNSAINIPTTPVFLRGWQTLVQTLGPAMATRFLRTVAQGHGDSVREFHELWEGMTLDEIIGEVRRGRRRNKK